MRHAVGRTPSPSEVEAAVVEERWTAFTEALEVHDRLHTPSSLSVLKFSYRAWRSAYLGEFPPLHVIDGGRS